MASIFIQAIRYSRRHRFSPERLSLSAQTTRAKQQRQLLTVIQQAQLGLDYPPSLSS